MQPAAKGPPKFVNNYKPAYNKYRSRTEIERDIIKEWKETTGSDGNEVPNTVRSVLAYGASWLKYNIVPEVVRYLWWLVWVRIVALGMQLRRKAVMQGAALDVWLAASGPAKRRIAAQRARALQRWHFKAGILDLGYRMALFKGQVPAGGSAAAWGY